MRDHYYGDALPVQFPQQRQDLLLAGGIQVTRGFVGEDDARPVDQGAGDGDALLLPAGQFVGLVVRALPQPHLGEQFLGALEIEAMAGIDQRHGHVLVGGGARQQIELLKDKSDGLAPQHRQVVFVEVGHFPAKEPIGTGLGGIEQADDMHEGGLAGTGGPGDGDVLPRRDLEGDATQGIHRGVAHGVGLVHVVKLDHQRRRSSAFCAWG